MPTLIRFAPPVLVAVLAAACAETGSPEVAIAPATTAGTTASPPVPEPVYELSEKELKLSCKKLTGRMQVRILQIRDYKASNNTSALSRGLQTVTNPVLGGSAAGLDPEGQYRKDRAILEAYNRQLAAKKCKTFDLDAELTAKPVTVTPTSSAQAKQGPAAKN